jgi:hypothetical protein
MPKRGLRFEEIRRPSGLIIASTETTVTVVNTVAETDLFSLTLPGGLVAPGDRIVIEAGGTELNFSGASVTYIIRLKIGATTALETTSTSMISNVNERRWVLNANIAIESTTAQRINALFMGSNVLVGAATWPQTNANSWLQPGYAATAEDTSTDKAIALTVQMGTAHANANMVMHEASLEHKRKI